MAESKHGHNKENVVLDKCQKLGTAIVTFDMLKIKHYNAIDFEKMMTATTTTIKGAAFILYNFARLQTLLTSFDSQVSRGFYDPLPEYDNIDFGLLKEEVCAQIVLFSLFFVDVFVKSPFSNVQCDTVVFVHHIILFVVFDCFLIFVFGFFVIVIVICFHIAFK